MDEPEPEPEGAEGAELSGLHDRDPTKIMCVLHGHRMKVVFKQLFGDIDYGGATEFQNCAVVKIGVNLEGDDNDFIHTEDGLTKLRGRVFSCDLLYSGPNIRDTSKIRTMTVTGLVPQGDRNIFIYIIRHGNSTHTNKGRIEKGLDYNNEQNGATMLTTCKNTHLTVKGILEARRCGGFFKLTDEFRGGLPKFNFITDLIRTYETLCGVYDGLLTRVIDIGELTYSPDNLFYNKDVMGNIGPVIMLPCGHETVTGKDGEQYKNWFDIFSGENTTDIGEKSIMEKILEGIKERQASMKELSLDKSVSEGEYNRLSHVDLENSRKRWEDSGRTSTRINGTTGTSALFADDRNPDTWQKTDNLSPRDKGFDFPTKVDSFEHLLSLKMSDESLQLLTDVPPTDFHYYSSFYNPVDKNTNKSPNPIIRSKTEMVLADSPDDSPDDIPKYYRGCAVETGQEEKQAHCGELLSSGDRCNVIGTICTIYSMEEAYLRQLTANNEPLIGVSLTEPGSAESLSAINEMWGPDQLGKDYENLTAKGGGSKRKNKRKCRHTKRRTRTKKRSKLLKKKRTKRKKHKDKKHKDKKHKDKKHKNKTRRYKK